ncbi:hypothetical protein A6A40_17305 (plasmid) [Azospirillum humicireducens]|uniref:Mu-like prophage FluMu N-terminal domain-containing protein n=1 Tax=Azospirillum humicireducens TaxID=1226968 RepID=A0A2R4VQT9_9PROT|nr:HI1506-related protein [Azospirillum humicireducens]AWB06809.1 hypothetical protein A6A40_17305 [Azospirillum humicireducens]
MKDLLIAARPAAGFRRCGLHHPPAEVRHPAGAFTEAEVRALKAEPNLIVIEAEPDGGADAAEKPARKAGKGKDAPAEAPPRQSPPPEA